MAKREQTLYMEDSKFRYTMHQIKKNKGVYGLLAPFFVLFLIFTIIPVLLSLPMGFTNFNMAQFPQWVGLSNFYSLFLEDEVFLIAIENTLVFAIITGPISYALCFILAWLINELPGALKTIFTFVFYAPTLAGNIYSTWQLIFSGDTYGIANAYLINLGITNGAIQWLTDANYIMGVLIVVQLWMALGAGFLAIRAGLQGIPRDRYEAGAIEAYQEQSAGAYLCNNPRNGTAAFIRCRYAGNKLVYRRRYRQIPYRVPDHRLCRSYNYDSRIRLRLHQI